MVGLLGSLEITGCTSSNFNQKSAKEVVNPNILTNAIHQRSYKTSLLAESKPGMRFTCRYVRRGGHRKSASTVTERSGAIRLLTVQTSWLSPRIFVLVSLLFVLGDSWIVSPPFVARSSHGTLLSPSTTLYMAKKKRRRRKSPPSTPSQSTAQPVKDVTPTTSDSADRETPTDEVAAEDLQSFRQVASFDFQPKSDSIIAPDDAISDDLTESKAIPLPDIREARRMKQAEEEKRKQEEEQSKRTKIRRSDKEAFAKVRRQATTEHWFLFALTCYSS